MEECPEVIAKVTEHYTAVERSLQTVPGSNTNTAVTYEEDKVVKDDSSCADANPLVTQSDALVVLMLNIFIPGVGTMFAAYRGRDGFNCKACGFGIAQMILTIVVAGTVWSIIQGINIYTKSNDYYGSSTVTVASANTSTGSNRRLDAKKLN